MSLCIECGKELQWPGDPVPFCAACYVKKLREPQPNVIELPIEPPTTFADFINEWLTANWAAMSAGKAGRA